MKNIWIVGPEQQPGRSTYSTVANDAAVAVTWIADRVEESELFEASTILRALAVALAGHTPDVVEGLRDTVMGYMAQHDSRIAMVVGSAGEEAL